jgi:hypothetical protein
MATSNNHICRMRLMNRSRNSISRKVPVVSPPLLRGRMFAVSALRLGCNTEMVSHEISLEHWTQPYVCRDGGGGGRSIGCEAVGLKGGGPAWNPAALAVRLPGAVEVTGDTPRRERGFLVLFVLPRDANMSSGMSFQLSCVLSLAVAILGTPFGEAGAFEGDFGDAILSSRMIWATPLLTSRATSSDLSSRGLYCSRACDAPSMSCFC